MLTLLGFIKTVSIIYVYEQVMTRTRHCIRIGLIVLAVLALVDVVFVDDPFYYHDCW